MNTFTIEIISRTPQKENGLMSYWGRINIDKFSEMFVLPISSWSLDQYKMQWQNALEHFEQHNESCFVTSVENLESPYPAVMMWTAYKDPHKKSGIFQNNLLLSEMEHVLLPLTQFSEKTCYQFIHPRGEVNGEGFCVNEDGDHISEWTIPLNDLLSQITIFKPTNPEFKHSPHENQSWYKNLRIENGDEDPL